MKLQDVNEMQYPSAGSMLRSFIAQVSEFANYELEGELQDDLLRLVAEFKNHSVQQGSRAGATPWGRKEQKSSVDF